MIDSEQIIHYYDSHIKELWGITAGGTLRSKKGTLGETLCEIIVKRAWKDIGGSLSRIYVGRQLYKISDKRGNVYRIGQDKQVYIDGEFILSIECKAYTEVAMYKRIIVDSLLLKSKFPELKFCIFQLESMLGGDYETNPSHPIGSPSVNVLNDFFPGIKIEILTMLDGGREIKREIHKEEFYKPLAEARVQYALDYFKKILSQVI